MQLIVKIQIQEKMSVNQYPLFMNERQGQKFSSDPLFDQIFKINDQSQWIENYSVNSQISKKIKTMLQHVSKSLARLLDNLNYLYNTNGIRYQVQPYYNTLMRLLTPFQLLSHFHITDNQSLFRYNSQNQKSQLTRCRYKEKCDQEFSVINKTKKEKERQKKQRKLNKLQQPSQTKISSLGQQNIGYYPLAQRKFAQKQKKNQQLYASKSLLGYSIQNEIVKWVLEQLINNKVLKMKHIAEKTKQIAYRVKGFKSSIGWVNRFLTRHPYLKIMMSYSKQKNYASLRQMYYRVKRVLENSNYQDIVAFNNQIMSQYKQTNSFQDNQSKNKAEQQSKSKNFKQDSDQNQSQEQSVDDNQFFNQNQQIAQESQPIEYSNDYQNQFDEFREQNEENNDIQNFQEIRQQKSNMNSSSRLFSKQQYKMEQKPIKLNQDSDQHQIISVNRSNFNRLQSEQPLNRQKQYEKRLKVNPGQRQKNPHEFKR